MDYICLIGRDGKFVVEKNKDFSSHLGIIKKSQIKIGKKVKTHLGKEFYAVEANIIDLFEKVFKKMPQSIMLKDLSIVLSYVGLPKNSLIIDAGLGSGFSSIFFAYYFKPKFVIAYEIEKKFIKVAMENITACNLGDIIKIKEKDITKGIDEKNVDFIHLDMEKSEKIIKNAYNALKIGGYLAVFSPTIDQVLKVNREIKKYNFSFIHIVENIVREWQFEKYLRPKTSGILHTGFYTFARKIC